MGEILVFLIILGFRATLHHNHKFPTFFPSKNPVTPAANKGPLIVMSLLVAAVLTQSVERAPACRGGGCRLIQVLKIFKTQDECSAFGLPTGRLRGSDDRIEMPVTLPAGNLKNSVLNLHLCGKHIFTYSKITSMFLVYEFCKRQSNLQ